MLKIQVLGNGMIPRGMGLAPRKAPFKADFTLITTIMNTPGLKVNFLNPETNKFQPLTPQNIRRMWTKYANWENRGLDMTMTTGGDRTMPKPNGEPAEGTPATESGEPKEEKVPEQPAVTGEPTQTPPNPPAEPEKPVEEKKDEVPAAEESKKEDASVESSAASVAAAAVTAEKKDEEKEEGKKDEPSTPTAPTPLRPVYNNGQKNNKHNK